MTKPRSTRSPRLTRLIWLACALACRAIAPAQAASEIVLHNFLSPGKGANPETGVIRDSAGNLYGTTKSGGRRNAGVVYKLDTSGRETVLHSFTSGADGGGPIAGVIRDSAGNLYGTTFYGGAANGGVVYKLDTAGHEIVLYNFTGGADGSQPDAGVIRDSAGNLYGTTYLGGAANAGVVYKLDPSGHETVLYSFTGGADGGYPGATPGLPQGLPLRRSDPRLGRQPIRNYSQRRHGERRRRV